MFSFHSRAHIWHCHWCARKENQLLGILKAGETKVRMNGNIFLRFWGKKHAGQISTIEKVSTTDQVLTTLYIHDMGMRRRRPLENCSKSPNRSPMPARDWSPSPKITAYLRCVTSTDRLHSLNIISSDLTSCKLAFRKSSYQFW